MKPQHDPLTFTKAGASHRREIFAQVFEVWPHADDPEVHLKKRLASIQHQRANWYCGLHQGKVVTSCGVYPLTLFGPGVKRRAGGIGAVFTPRPHRGQGFAAELLNWLFDELAGQGIHDLILFSDIAPAYYEKLGFCTLSSYEWTLACPSYEQEPQQRSWSIQKIPILKDHPRQQDTLYGLCRSRYDDIWNLARAEGPLRKIEATHMPSQKKYWILARIEGANYRFLEGNVPQQPHTWPLFKSLIEEELVTLGLPQAHGWWYGRFDEKRDGHELTPRSKEILMWRSHQQQLAPWYRSISSEPFRIYQSEHF
jgi:GNAT superfamily N-acetyltransferase